MNRDEVEGNKMEQCTYDEVKVQENMIREDRIKIKREEGKGEQMDN